LAFAAALAFASALALAFASALALAFALTFLRAAIVACFLLLFFGAFCKM